jgi:hypothetical protein
VRDRERQRDLLDPAGEGGRRIAAHLERQPDLGRDRGRDDLALGVLGDVADDRGQLARPWCERIDAGDLDATRDLPAVEMRDQAAARPQQGRLAAGGAAGEQDQLAGSKFERDVLKGGGPGAGIAVGEALHRKGRRQAGMRRELSHATS